MNLPPYKINNKLGVTITIGLYMGEDVIKTVILEPNELIPIDMDTLEELRRKKMTKRSSHRGSFRDAVSLVGSFHDHSQEEHRLGISLTLRDEVFESKKTIPIDRQGKFALDMTLKSLSKSSASSMRSSFNQTNSAVSSSSILPCIVADIAMKGDGGRDITLNSIYSIKNDTIRPLEVKFLIKGITDTAELRINCNEEKNIPLHMTNPYTIVKVRFDKNGEWNQAIPNLVT